MNVNQIRAALPGATLWDDVQKGLHLRVLGQNKSFYFFYRSKIGKQRRPKIGSFGEITLGEARSRARALSDRIARGEDPKGEWNDQKAEATVQGLWDRAFEKHWDTERFRKSGRAREVKRLFENQLKKPFGRLKLSEVTRPMVREWHGDLADKPYEGNRALEVLSRMFRFAEEQDLRPLSSNPCALIKGHAERKRKRYATEDEIRKIAPLLDKYAEKQPAGVAFLYLLLFTGSRPRAIERATWDELKEFAVGGEPYGILTFDGKSTAKTGQEEQVILPPQAMKALAKLPRIEGETITGVKMPHKLWYKVRAEAGCKDLWARDLRRTFATMGMSNGVDIGTIGELLNHQTVETTKVYAKVLESSQIKAAARIADRISETIAGTSSA